jgi:hypothetical protein
MAELDWIGVLQAENARLIALWLATITLAGVLPHREMLLDECLTFPLHSYAFI